MFSHGVNNKVEFRITELKALMRTTFREFHKFFNIKQEDIKKEEAKLFGSLKEKSPISFRMKKIEENKFNKSKESVVPHKNGCKEDCIEIGTKIYFYINIKVKPDEDKEIVTQQYIKILLLSAILGGIGKRARKGFGAFKINSIRELNGTEVKITGIEEIEKIINNKYVYNDDKKSDSFPYVERIEVIHLQKNINYKNVLKSISQATHDRLETTKYEDSVKNILGNYRKNEMGVKRFASPIYTTFYEYKGNRFIIIKHLNYEYLAKKLVEKTIKNEEKKTKKKLNKNDTKCRKNRFIMDSENYIKEYVEKIKKSIGVKLA